MGDYPKTVRVRGAEVTIRPLQRSDQEPLARFFRELPEGDRMLLSSCGFAPFSLCNPSETPRICELGHPGFDGIIASFTLQRGPVTFARLVEGSHGDYRLNYGTGVGADTELRQGRFPGLEIKLDGSPEKLWETMASQHFAMCYGDVTRELEDVCRWLGVEPVRI